MSDSIQLKPELVFIGAKEGSNLKVQYVLSLPCTDKEFDTFLKAAKKFSGEKEIEVASGLVMEFKRGGVKGVVKGSRKSTHYDLAQDAVDDYFNMPLDETLIYESEETEENAEEEGDIAEAVEQK